LSAVDWKLRARRAPNEDHEKTSPRPLTRRSSATSPVFAQQRNAVPAGGTGTGKTRLAIAIARSYIRSGVCGRFYNVVDLVNRLED
jgi:DNA replication protein DnaC